MGETVPGPESTAAHTHESTPTLSSETPKSVDGVSESEPKFEDPKDYLARLDADKAVRQQEAQVAVAAASIDGVNATYPPARDAEGYKKDGYNGGDKLAHAAEIAQAATTLAQSNDIPTAAEKAAIQKAGQDAASRPRWRQLLDQFSGK